MSFDGSPARATRIADARVDRIGHAGECRALRAAWSWRKRGPYRFVEGRTVRPIGMHAGFRDEAVVAPYAVVAVAGVID